MCENGLFTLKVFSQPHPNLTSAYLSIGVPWANTIRPSTASLAETRFHRSIGFRLWFDASGKRGNTLSGDIYWLPETTEISVSESIDLILRDRYRLVFERIAPQWIKSFQLPSQITIIESIQEKEKMVMDLTDKLENDRLALDQESRFLKMLYEQGEDVLEPIVRDALRNLGAKVEEPKQRGKEDGRLIDISNRRGMLEIKGRTGNLRLSDIRELDNWVRNAIANESWHSKGIMIANLQCNKAPDKRKNTIPRNSLEAAENFDIIILTTTQLFHALVMDQNGTLDRNFFWDQVFSSKGICSLPEVR